MLEKPTRPLTDADERVKAIMGLVRLYGVKQFDKARLDAMLEALADLKTPALLLACKAVSRVNDRFPPPSIIRRFAETVPDADKAKPPSRIHREDVPLTAEAWLEFHNLEVRPEWLARGMDGRLARAAEEAATCGERDECQQGKCREQVPVPRTTQLYRGTQAPPTLYLAYVPCGEHETRCAWRAQHRKADRDPATKGRAA